MAIMITPPGFKNLAAPLADYTERFNGCQRERDIPFPLGLYSPSHYTFSYIA